MKHGPVYKAVLLVSLMNKDPRKLDELAKKLRCQQGVRHIEAVISREPGGWFSEPRIPEPTITRHGEPPSPWRPYGAMLVVEAPSDGDLQKCIELIFKSAIEVDSDPELMAMNGADAW